jgi:RNA polymerase sigma-70 factor (ECF subfamily)
MIDTLIEESKRGNPEAFRGLYNRLSEKVFAFTRSRCRTRDDALDVLQETFIDFWEKIPSFSYSSERALYAYLYTIASRKISRLYRFSFRKTVSIDDLEDVVGETAHDVEEKTEFSLLLSLLQRMSERDREVLELRYVAGLSFADIADLREEKETTVKVRHHRALERLKQHYE